MKNPFANLFSKSRVAGVLLILLASAGVTKAVLADSPTIPRAKDKAKSERQLGGESDQRLDVPVGHWLSGPGVVEPRERETKLAAETSGTIAKILVKEGVRVKTGEPLIELESSVERAAVVSAEADASASESELARARNGNRGEDKRAAAADASAAEARAKSSASVFERLRQAAEGGAVTLGEVDRARRQAEADESSATASSARGALVLAGSRSEDIAIARARSDAAKGRLEEARARLAWKTVSAPVDGEVLQIKVRLGEHYQPGADPLLVLGDTSVKKARIDVDERDLGKLHEGSRVLLRAAAFPGRDFEAKIVEIAPRMGRKNVRTDDPIERNDTKILEVVAEITEARDLFVGQRVTGFIEAP